MTDCPWDGRHVSDVQCWWRARPAEPTLLEALAARSRQRALAEQEVVEIPDSPKDDAAGSGAGSGAALPPGGADFAGEDAEFDDAFDLENLDGFAVGKDLSGLVWEAGGLLGTNDSFFSFSNFCRCNSITSL